MNKQKSWASIYANEVVICIQTHSGLRVSAFDPAGKQYLFEPIAAPERLGYGLLDALDASRVLDVKEIKEFFEPVKMKQRYEDWVAKLLRHTGYGDRKKLFSKMKHCTVVCESELISIRPTLHEEDEGWAGQELSQIVQVSRHAAAAEVGQGILLALSRSSE